MQTAENAGYTLQTMTQFAQRIEVWPIERLKPYERNARTHSPDQVTKIAASLAEFGFVNPILVDSSDGIIAGHGRLAAATELGLPEVPVIVLDHLTDSQRRAYILADNKLAELAGWDVDILRAEMAEIAAEDPNLLELAGFAAAEIEAALDDDGEGGGEGGDDGDDVYTRKIEAPTYTAKEEHAPPIPEMIDTKRAEYLTERILDADLPEDVRDFLVAAAQRHVIFDYKRIAEFYCHASPQVQRLMEESALVIVDFNKAIEGGFVELSKKLIGIYSATYEKHEDDEDPEAIENAA